MARNEMTSEEGGLTRFLRKKINGKKNDQSEPETGY